MDKKVVKFLSKTGIRSSDILYLLRDERKTVIHLKNGTVEETYIPMKYLLAALPKGAFLNITKGVVVAAAEIESIDGSVYKMRNGESFIGRKRGAGEHKTNRRMLENRVISENRIFSQTMAESFGILANAQLPCCVLELVYNSAGHGVDFVVRCCNEAFLKAEGAELDEVIDRSFFDLFKSVEREWIDVYRKTAITGVPGMVTDTDLKTGEKVRVFCHQPTAGCCVCIMVRDPKEEDNI